MTGDIKVILAATDLSRSGEIAARRAATLARAAGARLELVHVLCDFSVLTSWMALRGALAPRAARSRVGAVGGLRRAAARVEAEFSLAVGTHLAEGKPHAEIARRAEAIGADVVVLGARGGRHVRDALVGTTAQRVQRRLSVPVLVARKVPVVPYEHVLIATDFSPASAEAARAARGLFPDAALHMLNVYHAPFESRLALAGLDAAAIAEYRHRAAVQALRELDSFAREAAFEEKPSLRVRHGWTPGRIKERAAELDADVIVLGTEGKSWLEVGFLGSVSGRVAAGAPCDVLVARASG